MGRFPFQFRYRPARCDNQLRLRRDASDDNSESAGLTIFGKDADDAATFNSGSNNLSSRSMTSASVVWSNVEDWKKNQWHDTPGISAVIQEIVNRSGWADGNDLVILVRSDDLNGKRLAFSHDDNGNKAAKLHIEYTTAPGGGALLGLRRRIWHNGCRFFFSSERRHAQRSDLDERLLRKHGRGV